MRSVVGEVVAEGLWTVYADGVRVLSEFVEIDLFGGAVGLDFLVAHGLLLEFLEKGLVVGEVGLLDLVREGGAQLLMAQQVQLGVEGAWMGGCVLLKAGRLPPISSSFSKA